MLRKTLALGTLTLFASLAASPLNAADPATLLRLAFDSPQKISYEGEVQSTEIGDSQAMVSVYRVEHLAPDLTRRWYIAPQSIYGDSVISRGQRTYNVDVKNNRLVVDQNGAIDDQVAINDNFDLLASNYRVETAPDDTIANRTTRVLLLVNKHTGATTMRVWIDAQTHLVLQKERYAANGSLTSQVRFEELHYTSTIPAAIFALPTGFTRSTGIRHGAPTNDIPKLVDAAGFNAKHPRYLPDGFLAVTGDVSDVNNVRTLHLLYSDGIRTVSLFQNARGASVDMSHYTVHDIAIQNHTGRYVEQGPITLLAWSGSGLHFTIVGELSRDELVKIAASIAP